MNEPAKKTASKMVVQLSTDELYTIIANAVQAAIKAMPRDDRLLSVEQVCQILNVSDQWLYYNAKKLPFVRKLGGLLRFRAMGYSAIESRRFTTAAKGPNDDT